MIGPKPVLAGLWLVSFVWVLAIVCAPISIEPGTVRGLDGQANVLDYAPLWRSLPTFAGIVYTLGDVNCHQMESRTWLVNGNQMPIDARMTAASVGALVGLALAMIMPASARVRDAISMILPRSTRERLSTDASRLFLVALAWGLVALPAAIDVGVQFATTYESTNLRRALTGLWLGLGSSFLVGILIDSLWAAPTLGLPGSASQQQSD